MLKYFLSGLSLMLLCILEVSLAVSAHADVVYGRVADIGNGPLDDVAVTVERGTETVGVATTGSDGYFAVTGVDIDVSDILQLTFVKPKYVTSVSSLQDVVSSSVECNEIHMKRGTGTENLLTVTVLDGVTPVPAARVRFKRIGEFAVVKYSDSQGECVFERLRNKTYNYSVVAGGFVTLRGTKSVSGDESIDLALTAE